MPEQKQIFITLGRLTGKTKTLESLYEWSAGPVLAERHDDIVKK